MSEDKDLKKALNLRDKMRDIGPIRKAWTDEAREASAEARRGKGKAVRPSTPELNPAHAMTNTKAFATSERLAAPFNAPNKIAPIPYAVVRQGTDHYVIHLPSNRSVSPDADDDMGIKNIKTQSLNGKLYQTGDHSSIGRVIKDPEEGKWVSRDNTDLPEEEDFVGYGDGGEEIHGNSRGDIRETKPKAGREVVPGPGGEVSANNGPHAILPSGRIDTSTGKNEYWDDGTNEVWRKPDGNHFIAHTAGDEPLHGIGSKATFKHDQTGRSMHGGEKSEMVGWFHTNPNGKRGGIVPGGKLPVATYK